MSRLGRLTSALALAPLGVLLAAGPSYAVGHKPDACGDVGVYCTKVGGQWVVNDTNSGGLDPGGGIPGWFGAFFVLALVVGIATTVWKVTTAQRLAKQAGLDPGLATQVALLTDNGLDATYLASSLRPPAAPTTTPGSPSAPTHDVATRLAELKNLLDQGAVTQAEYDGRRQAIIDSV
jgi:hypothetical protein